MSSYKELDCTSCKKTNVKMRGFQLSYIEGMNNYYLEIFHHWKWYCTYCGKMNIATVIADDDADIEELYYEWEEGFEDE